MENKRIIYFDSLVEQDSFEKGRPVTAFTERMRKTDVLNLVSEERIEKIEGNVVHIKKGVIEMSKADEIRKKHGVHFSRGLAEHNYNYESYLSSQLVDVLNDHVSKSELIDWLHEQIEENRNSDDNVLTRLGIAAGFQMVLDKLIK